MNNKRDLISSLFGSIFAIAFAIVWMTIAGKIAKFMIIFGIIFIGIAIVNIVKVISIYKKRTNFNSNEFNEITYNAYEQFEEHTSKPVASCPFCRTTVSVTDCYCKNCGTKLK